MADSRTGQTTGIRARWPFYVAPWIVLGLGLLTWIFTAEPLVERALTRAEQGVPSPWLKRVADVWPWFMGEQQALRITYGKPLPLPISFPRRAWESTWRPRARSGLILGGALLCLIGNVLLAARRNKDGDDEAAKRTGIGVAVVLGAGAALLFLLLAVPIATRTVYTADDLYAFHIPLRKFVVDSWARGDRPSWCPLLNCGYDLHGEGQVGLDHPWHQFLYRALPLDLAINLEMLGGFAFAWAGATLMFRRWGLGLGPSLFGAFTFTFGNVFRKYFHMNAVGVISHIPWLVLCIDVLARESERRTIVAARVAIALLTASQLLLGYPQWVWISLVAEGLYLAISVASSGRRVGLATDYFLGKTMGLLLGASQWLPTVDLLSRSTRTMRDPAAVLELSASGSLHPLNYLILTCPFALTASRGYAPGVVSEGVPSFYVWPELSIGSIGANFQEFSFYAGLTPIILAVGLLACRREGTGARTAGARALAFGGVLIVLGAVLSLGRFSPLLPLLARIPLVNVFRCPARYATLMTFGLAIVASFALARLGSSGDGRRWGFRSFLLAAAVLLAANLVAVALKAGLVRDPNGMLVSYLPRWPVAVINPLLATTILGLFVLTLRGSRRALLLLVSAHVIDLSLYDLAFLWEREPNTMTIADLCNSDAIPASWFGGRIQIDNRSGKVSPNPYTLYGLQVSNAYLGLVTRDELDYRRPEAQRVAGVRWILRSWVIAEAQPVAGALPEVRLLSRARRSDEPRRELAEIDLETTALVDVPVNIGNRADMVPGEARVLARRNAEYRVKTRADSAQLLVVSTRYNRGWKVQIDGSPATVVRANGDFVGCAVPAGEHEIHLAWEPASHPVGRAISLAGLGLLAISIVRTGAILPRRRRRSDAEKEVVDGEMARA